MKLFPFIIFLISLGVIVFQDFKQRSISWWILPVTLIAYLVYSDQLIDEILNSFLLNLLFIVVNLLVITIYFSIKESSLVNIVDSKIGLGDILFFVVCAFIFNLPSFILFFTFSLLLSAIIAVVFKTKMQERNIPLAGIMSGILFLLSTSSRLMSIDFMRNDEWMNSILL
ncbi:MAG: prepilin peptidase [Flavobacteriales bacterium]|nr:prepilin peptidase [Flavobacteriales bacterium]